MTPPKKTSRSASPAKRGAAKTPAPKKKRTRRKKTGGSFTALLLACAVGIALTLSAIWLVRQVDAPKRGAQVAVSGGERKLATPSGKTSGKSAPDREAPARPASPPSGGSIPTSPPRSAEPTPVPAGGATAEGAAVTSALIDLKALPYEEALNASLDERIRQVDYALMQAAWLKKLPASDLRLVSVEDRLEGVEPYQYQIIDILPGPSAKEYTDSLKSCLGAWAEGTVLKDQGDNHWLIYVNGVQTHHIRLFPGKREFPPLPARPDGNRTASDQSSPLQASYGLPRSEALPGTGVPSLPQRPGIGRHPLRAPGEPARMVIVIDDLGASQTAAQQLLALDYPVTFAFWPHGNHTRQDAEAAHRAGREILIHLPMEPLGYPRVRPGPNVLLVGMPPEKIQAIIDAAVAAVPHAVGLNNHMGSRFTQNTTGTDEVAAGLKRHGLFALDSLTHNSSVFAARARQYGLETYQRNVFLDVTASRSKIIDELKRAEHIALLTGQSIAIGHPLPETLSALKEWQRVRNKEVRIVRLQDLER